MGCSETKELISAMLDGEAAEEELTLLHQHLAGCGECRSFQSDLLRLRERLKEWPDETPRPSRVEPTLDKWPASPAFVQHWWGLAALLVLAAGVGYLAGRIRSAPLIQTAPRQTQSPQEVRFFYPAAHEVRSTIVLESFDPTKVVLP